MIDKDEIVKLALEAMPYEGGNYFVVHSNEIEHFAALVAAAEREACAKVCELIDTSAFGTERPAPNDCAAAIRARSNT